MRISDWSSDVCSSDLDVLAIPLPAQIGIVQVDIGGDRRIVALHVVIIDVDAGIGRRLEREGRLLAEEAALGIIGAEIDLQRVGDRKIVGEGKSVSVRVDLGGSRIIKKKKT